MEKDEEALRKIHHRLGERRRCRADDSLQHTMDLRGEGAEDSRVSRDQLAERMEHDLQVRGVGLQTSDGIGRRLDRDEIQRRRNEPREGRSGYLANESGILVSEVEDAGQGDDTHFLRRDGVGFLSNDAISFLPSGNNHPLQLGVFTVRIPNNPRTNGSHARRTSH